MSLCLPRYVVYSHRAVSDMVSVFHCKFTTYHRTPITKTDTGTYAQASAENLVLKLFFGPFRMMTVTLHG